MKAPDLQTRCTSPEVGHMEVVFSPAMVAPDQAHSPSAAKGL